MRRRGITMIELVASIAIAGALATIAVQMLELVSSSRRSADLRRLATVELSNRAEELRARPASELTPETLATIRPSDAWLARAPSSRLVASVAPSDDPPMKKLTLELQYAGPGSVPPPPVRLVLWLRREDRP